jgi:hypothetical protein
VYDDGHLLSTKRMINTNINTFYIISNNIIVRFTLLTPQPRTATPFRLSWRIVRPYIIIYISDGKRGSGDDDDADDDDV